MKFITDLHEISRLSDLNRQENFDFRAKIKWGSKSPEALDRTVNKIQKAVSAQIDCQKCANCCKTFDIPLTDHDIQRLSAGMSLGVEEFSTCPIVFNVWEQLKEKLASPHKS